MIHCHQRSMHTVLTVIRDSASRYRRKGKKRLSLLIGNQIQLWSLLKSKAQKRELFGEMVLVLWRGGKRELWKETRQGEMKKLRLTGGDCGK